MVRGVRGRLRACVCGVALLLLPAFGSSGCADGVSINTKDFSDDGGIESGTADATAADTGPSTGDATAMQDTGSSHDAGGPETSAGCGSNADCAKSPGKVCSQGACVECVDNTTCSAPTPKCDVATSTCVACLAAGDCMPGYICGTNDTCEQGCSSTQPCPTGQVCNMGGCVQCTTDANCSGATPRCNTTTNTCVQCLPAMDNCGTDQYCSG